MNFSGPQCSTAEQSYPMSGALWVSRITPDGQVYVKQAFNDLEDWAKPHLNLCLSSESKLSTQIAEPADTVQMMYKSGLPESHDFKHAEFPSLKLHDVTHDKVDHGKMHLKAFCPEVVGNAKTMKEALDTIASMANIKSLNLMDLPMLELVILNAEANLAVTQTNDCLFYVVGNGQSGPPIVGQILAHKGSWFAYLTQENGDYIDSPRCLGCRLPLKAGLYVIKEGQVTSGIDYHPSSGDYEAYQGLTAEPTLATEEDLVNFGLTISDVGRLIEETGCVSWLGTVKNVAEMQEWLESEPILTAKNLFSPMKLA
jgi:hypothetical protein